MVVEKNLRLLWKFPFLGPLSSKRGFYKKLCQSVIRLFASLERKLLDRFSPISQQKHQLGHYRFTQIPAYNGQEGLLRPQTEQGAEGASP